MSFTLAEAVQHTLLCPGRCAAGYEDCNVKKPIVLLGSGSGNGDESPLDQLKALCPEDHVAYGYIRMVGPSFSALSHSCCALG